MTGPELSPVPREARPFQGEPAGLVTRLVANTLDTLAVTLAVGAGYLAWAAFLFMLDPLAFRFPQASLLLLVSVGLVVAVIYLWLSWWLAGKSWGGHVMGIRVTGRRGRRLGPLRSLARAGFCVLFPVGLFWCLISPRRRSVQDVVLFTTVVYDWLPHPARAGGLGGVDAATGSAHRAAGSDERHAGSKAEAGARRDSEAGKRRDTEAGAGRDAPTQEPGHPRLVAVEPVEKGTQPPDPSTAEAS